MRVSEVDEGVAVEPEISGRDEAESLAVEGLVELDEVILIVVIDDNDTLVVGGAEWQRRYMNSMDASVATLTLTLGLRSLSWVSDASALEILPT